MSIPTDYIRFAALGDSATFGLGDPVESGWRGWAHLLSDGMAPPRLLLQSGAARRDRGGGPARAPQKAVCVVQIRWMPSDSRV